jgi:hypothetical protein
MDAMPLLKLSFYVIIYSLLGLMPTISHASDPNQDRFIIGHYRNNVLHNPLYEIDDIRADRLTHLIYQNADLTAEGDVVLGHRFLDIQ